MTGLHVQLDVPLPAELAVGSGTALFVAGWCVHAQEDIRALRFVVDGEPQPVAARGMPRLDVLHAAGAYRSGFWGIVRIGPRAGAVTLGLRAELAGGGTAEAELARIPPAPPPVPDDSARPEREDGPLVAICMAAYDPPQDLLERQLASIRAQTHRRWICLISDDGSRPERYAALAAAIDGDPRFALSRAPRRLGFYRNFERALGLVPPAVDHVALADQDDDWQPDKLATLLRALDGGAQLAYSDARIVDRDGLVLAASYWERRRNNHADLTSLLVANAVTGAASCFPRALLDDALPFPPAQFAHFHDHWLGLVALARGEIAYVPLPLYDYVQHGAASLGHAAANRMPGLRERLRRQDPRERVRLWRLHYFADVARLQQLATVLLLRCGDRTSARKRRALERFLRTDRSLPALARLWARGARELTGRPETLGAEWMLAHAFTWRRLLAATARDRPQRRLRLDAVPPPNLAPGPGRAGLDSGPARALADKLAPLTLDVRTDAPRRVNLLIPAIDLQHLFGGYIAKLNLARRLAERGARVRIVTVDPAGPLPRGWARDVEAYGGLADLFERVELAFGREAGPLEVSPADAFIATTWWTAHIAHAALGGARFLYLIQEYEPFTFAMGSHAALAAESYRFPHAALFSSQLLREHFRTHGIGVYAAGTAAGDRASLAFENAITRVDAPDARELSARTERGLLFYARPEPHAARNMFELGVLALARAVERGAFEGRWRLRGIGTVGAARRLALGGGAELELLPRAAQDTHAQRLRAHDVGLALMYTPHPSLVPIEMASAGMLTVTNTFAPVKTAAALAAISPNLIAAEPGVEAIADALCAAAAGAQDGERRARGSHVRWSRTWEESFDDALLDRVLALLGP